MIAWLRTSLLVLAAPTGACGLISLAASKSIDQFTFLPMVFALPGSLLILAPVAAATKRRAIPEFTSTALLLIAGAGCGALVLGLLTGMRADGFAWGGLYGLVTAGCWAVLDRFGRMRRPHH